MAEVIGSLRVLLGVDTAAFSEGLTKAEKSLAAFSKNFGTIAAAAAAAVVAAGAGLAVGLGKALEQADSLGKMAQKFGVPVEELSKLKFAAELSDVSLESLGKGLGKLSRTMTEALAKPTSEASNAFKALGVSVRNSDGSVKTSEQTFLDIADAFAGLNDGAGKTAVAIALFGRAGADLIPLLNQGKAGIQALKEEAAALGLVITADTARAAEEFNDNLKRLSKTYEVVMTQFAAGAAGPLAATSTALVEIQKSSTLAKDAGAVLASVFLTIVEGVTIAAAHFRSFANDIRAVFNFIKSLGGTRTEIAAAFTAMTTALKTNQKELQATVDAFKPANIEMAQFADGMAGIAGQTQKATKAKKDFNYAVLGGKDALTGFLESTAKSTAGLKAQSDAFGASAGQAAFLKITYEALAIAQEKGIVLDEKRRLKIIEAANAMGMAAAQISANALIEESIPAWQKLEDKVVEIQGLMELFPAKAAQLGVALKAVQEAQLLQIGQAFEAFAGGFAQLFGELGRKNKTMFEIGQAFAIGQAIINTALGATKALSAYPPPFNYIAMAGVIAAGLAQVIKIKSQKFNPTTAAAGGSFRVPGGVTGVDSRLVPMMLSPGERVDVTPASRAGAGAGDRTLVIPPIRPKDFFTGETVREMVFAIDQWMKDGGTGVRVTA